MNLLADENVDKAIVDGLRSDGHTVLYIAEMEPGIDDDAVLSQTSQIGALLITADKDFGELVFRLGRNPAGVVLIRLAGLSAEAKARNVSNAFADHSDQLISAFNVVSPGRLRIRRTANRK